MAMTQQVKTELATIRVTKPCCRRAEVASMLRFAGGIHIVSGRIVIEAEFDTGAAARRLRTAIQDLYGFTAEMIMVNGSGIRRGTRYTLRLVSEGESLARQTGLTDAHGRPVRGLPAIVVGGGTCCQVAAWRGAFLAHGSLTEPGRSMALEVTCPGSEAALALVGAARRLQIGSKAREVRNVDRVVIRDGDAIAAMLTGWAPTSPCWPGKSGGCVARSAPPPTGWPISTTPTCAVLRGPPSLQGHAWSALWRSSGTRSRTTSRPRDFFAWSTRMRAWKNWVSCTILR